MLHPTKYPNPQLNHDFVAYKSPCKSSEKSSYYCWYPHEVIIFAGEITLGILVILEISPIFSLWKTPQQR